MVEIKSMIIPISNARSGGVRSKTIGVTIHNTGNYSNGSGALNHGNYLLGGGKNSYVSWHYAVDDKLISQSIPLNEIAWHAGDGGNGKGNTQTIAIEICVNPESNLTVATDNAAELTAWLLKQYSLSTNDVYQHYYWCGKNCPMEIRKGNPYTWSDFINKVNHYMGNVSAQAPSPSTPPPISGNYKVGDKVRFTSCYASSTDPIGFPPSGKAVHPSPGFETGVITKIYEGTNNPYLINDGQCFVNDGDIAEIIGASDVNQASSSTANKIMINIRPGTWNVRNAPNMSGKVMKIISGGTQIESLGKSGDWYIIDGGYIGPAAVYLF